MDTRRSPSPFAIHSSPRGDRKADDVCGKEIFESPATRVKNEENSSRGNSVSFLVALVQFSRQQSIGYLNFLGLCSGGEALREHTEVFAPGARPLQNSGSV